MSPLLALGLALAAQAAEPLDRAAYEKAYPVTTGTAAQKAVINRCLAAWGDHPFDAGDLRFRVVATQVRVMGAGAQTRDDAATTYPQLVFIQPAVSVMSGTTYHLLNPNGWYCFDATVSVMAKTVVRAHCSARIADSRSSAAVMGDNTSAEKGGVTVLGSTEVQRVGCE